MKEKMKKLFENGRGAIFALFILELLLTFFITPNKYDDKTFLESVTGTSIWSYVAPRYFNWTSRFLIEYTLCGVLKISKYMWILIEALMVTLAGYSISKLFIKEDKKENNSMLLFMILIYPITLMNSAGWAATTINYMWPLATALFAMIPIRKIWDKEKFKWFEFPLYTLALIFAGNQEQTCAILVGVYLVFAILMILKNKKIHPYMVIQTILIIASIIFILTCPGNYVRNSDEIEKMFKDFEMLTFLDKVGLGFTSMVGVIAEKDGAIFLLLNALITVYIFNNYKEKLYRIVALIPLIFVIVMNYSVYITNLMFPYFGAFKTLITTEKIMLTAANCSNILNVMPLFLAFSVIICMIMSILLIFKNLKNNVAILVFLAGLASRVIIGFSPTVFSSGDRTLVFFDFAMIIVSILIWQELVKKTDKNDKKIQKRAEFFIKLAGTMQYINLFLCILLTQK